MSLYRTPDSFWFRSCGYLKFEGELVNFTPLKTPLAVKGLRSGNEIIKNLLI